MAPSQRAAARERAADRVGADGVRVERLDRLRGDDAAEAAAVQDHVVRCAEVRGEDLDSRFRSFCVLKSVQQQLL